MTAAPVALQAPIAPPVPVIPSAGNPASPDYKSAAWQRMLPGWTLCEDVMGGTQAIRAKTTQYLPQAPLEQQDEYNRRLLRTEFYNGFERTVRGLTGMVFRRNIELSDDVPEPLVEDWENIDGGGTHGDVFSRLVFEDGMVDGMAAILVDFPSLPKGAALTLADEKRMGLRPYWVHVKAKQIVSARVKSIFGRVVLTQAVIEEHAMVADGPFGEKDECRYRVFRLNTTPYETGKGPLTVTWEVWTEQTLQGGAKALLMTGNGTLANQTAIPLVPVYCGPRLAPFEVKPPLLDLAYANIAHYQVQSDHRYSLHIASVPILVFKGRDTSGGKQAVGPNVGIDVDKDGDVKYVEHAGTALEATRNELKDLETRMASLGLAMLQQETRAAETAEAKRIDKAEQDSALAVAARGLQDAIEQALIYHAAYRRVETGGSVLVNREFEELTLTPQMIQALSSLQIAGQISLDTLWDMLETGNLMPEDFEPEKEKLKLVIGSMMAGAGAGAAGGGNGGNGGDGGTDDEPPPQGGAT